MKTKSLEKLLKNHLPHCKVHEFSLQEKRHCTCGIEKAREELELLFIDLPNTYLEMWAKDLLELMDGKPKPGTRGGEHLEEVERRLVDLRARAMKAIECWRDPSQRGSFEAMSQLAIVLRI